MDSSVVDSSGDGVGRRPGGREFGKLWAATGASNLGDGVWLVAAPLLAAGMTRDPVLISGLAVAQRAPWLLFGLVGGAMADRLDRRRTMVAIALLRASLVGALGLAVLLGWTSMPLLYVVFFLIATGETLFDTSAVALVPAVVLTAQLTTANARLAGTFTVTNQFVGPPLGGLLFGVAASAPFLLGAGGLVASAGMLGRLRGSFAVERTDDGSRGSLRAEIGEGLRWLWGHRLLRTMSVTLGVLNLVLVAQVAIMILVAEERLGLGSRGYGVLVTAYGVGGVLGSLVAGRVRGLTGDAAYLRIAVVVEGVVPVVIALTTSAYVVGAMFVALGVHATVWGAILVSLRQELTPDRLRGKVAGVYGVIESGSAAVGALLGGVLAAMIGLTAPFWVAAGAAAVLLACVWRVFSEETIAAARAGVRA